MFRRRHALGLAAMGALASTREARAAKSEDRIAGGEAVVETRVTGGGVASQLVGSCSRGADHRRLTADDSRALILCPICGCAIPAWK